MQTKSPASVRTAIEEMVRGIVSELEPERIILFGSHARGTPHPDSDVDLMVIFSPGISRRRLTADIYYALAGLGVSKDIIVITTDEVERFRDVPGTILWPALREGKTLYERTERSA